MVWHAARCYFGLSLLTCAACGDSGDERTVVVQELCDSIDSCSIRDEACQRAVLELTACVRGDDVPELPPIRTLSREELARELAESAAAELTPPSDTSRAIEQVFAALQLIAQATSLSDAAVAEQTGSTAAFYRRDEQDVTIISDAAMDPDQALNALSHELTHYLQDRAGQLEAASESSVTLDESVARRALTEGDAIVTSYRVGAAMRGLLPSELRWSALWNAFERSVAQSIEASAAPLVAAVSQLPYVIAAPTLELAWERGGRSFVNDIYEQPPLTQLDWVEGSLGLTLAEPLDCYPALPPDGYKLIAADSLGVAGLFALLGSLDDASLSVASAWRQDRLVIYVQDGAPEHVLAAWRIRFVDDARAAELESRLARLELDVTRSEAELLIRVAAGADTPVTHLDARSCPTEDQFVAVIARSRDVEASLRVRLERAFR